MFTSSAGLLSRKLNDGFRATLRPTAVSHDPEAAEQSMFGGFIASGWFTASLVMRLKVDHIISHVAGLGSPRVDELRWLKPVFAGDTLSVRVTIIEAKRSSSKPDRGYVGMLNEVLNQNSAMVMTVKSGGFYLCGIRKR